MRVRIRYCGFLGKGWFLSMLVFMFLFFRAEDGIRDLVRSRGLGDVCKRTGLALTRCGARVGDDVYVSGVIGHGAAGLKVALSVLATPGDSVDKQQLDALLRFNRPQPRVELGMALRGIATSCIDVSDGLFADLQHVLSASGVGACLALASIPLSEAVVASILFSGKSEREKRLLACNAGDDYELCFTAPRAARERVALKSDVYEVGLTRIGRIESGDSVLDDSGAPLVSSGYQHF